MPTIGLVSFNTDGLKATTPGIIEMLSNKFFNETSPNIYVEATQEDARDPDEPLLGTQRIAPYTLVGKAALNNKSTKQNAILKVYVHNSKVGSLVAANTNTGAVVTSPKESKPYVLGLQRFASALPGVAFGFTKGACYVTLNFGAEGKFIFVNMHLPVSTSKFKKGEQKGELKDPTLGVEYRKQSLQELLQEIGQKVGQKVSQKVDDATTVIVTGDLNFRMDYNGVNQLTGLLPTFSDPFTLQEIDTLGKEIFTCKFKPNSSRDCRLRSIPPRNTSYTNAVKAHQAECGDAERTPSRCDRVLYRLASGKSMETLMYDVDVLDPSSDHNAIFALLKVSPSTEVVGKPANAPIKNIGEAPTLPLANIENTNNSSSVITADPETNETPAGGRRKTKRVAKKSKKTRRLRRLRRLRL